MVTRFYLAIAAGTLLAACQTPAPQFSEEPTMTETVTLQTEHGTLAYQQQGEGPLVILMPGLGDVRQSYRFMAPLLADAGYTAVSMDLRGHGDTSAPWPEYTTEAIARDLLHVIAHLDLGSAIVVGNSFSAGVGVWAATEQPDAITGLAMIGPFVRDHGDEMGFMQRLSMRVLLNGPWKVRSWLCFHGTLFTEKPADHEEYRARLGANLSEPHRFDALKQMLDRSDAEVEARLSQVTQPTLIIMGTLDPDYPDPAEEAQWIADQLTGEVALIDNAGHYPQAEKPTETTAVLLDFLRAHSLHAIE